MWVLFISKRPRGKCSVPKSSNSTDVPVLPWALPPLLPDGGFGHLPLTQLPVQGRCWPHKDTAIPLQEERTISPAIHTHFLRSADQTEDLPTPPSVFICFMPYPMDVHQICLQVLMAMQLWHHFSLRNLCHVRDVSQILEFYQLRRAEPGPQLKNGGHSYSANLQLWDMGWRKALALP